MSTPSNPKPVSPPLDSHMREALSQIPTGKRGQISATVTTIGVEASLGVRVVPRVTVSGWAGREWGARGWSAGVRSAFVF